MSEEEWGRFAGGCKRVVDDLGLFVTRFHLMWDVTEIQGAAGNTPPARLLFHLRHALEQSAIAALLRAREPPRRGRASVPELLEAVRSADVRSQLASHRWHRLYPDADHTRAAVLIDRAVADLRVAFAPIEEQGRALRSFRNHEAAHANPDRPADGPWPTYGDISSLVAPAHDVSRLLVFLYSGVVSDPVALHQSIREENCRHLAAIRVVLLGGS